MVHGLLDARQLRAPETRGATQNRSKANRTRLLGAGSPLGTLAI